MNIKLHRVRWMMAVAFGLLTVLSASATDYRNPAQVKSAIEQAMQQPQSGEAKYFYSSSISHFDGFIPFEPGMKADYDQTKPHYKYTYVDGRVTKAEFFESAGQLENYYGVWNNSVGAPVVSAYFGKNGAADWYIYGEYDNAGKIHLLYRFSASFELERTEEFSYEGNATRIKTLNPEGKSTSETLYENGDVFVITNGEKKKVNEADRDRDIRSLARFGLKPIYPGY